MEHRRFEKGKEVSDCALICSLNNSHEMRDEDFVVSPWSSPRRAIRICGINLILAPVSHVNHLSPNVQILRTK